MQTDGNRLANENNMVIKMASPTSLPFDVEKDLNGYNKVYITKQFNLFRTFHCCEFLGGDYIVYGLLPDGDKKFYLYLKNIINVVISVMIVLLKVDFVIMYVATKYYFKWIIKEII